MRNARSGRNRRGSVIMIAVVVLAVLLILGYVLIMGKFLEYSQNQNYNDFACNYMRENQEFLSVDKDPLWYVPGAKAIQAKPFETAVGVASCGLVLPTVTNNTGNITALLRNYSQDACAYGNNNSYKEFTWVRSLPVNITDGDMTYNTLNPSGTPPGIVQDLGTPPPGLDPPNRKPCYLIWRINDSYVKRGRVLTDYNGREISDPEIKLKNGTIKNKIITNLRIDYFQIEIHPDYIVGYISGGERCKKPAHCTGVVEIWGMPQ